MRTPPQILIVDDNPTNLDIFETRLATHGYDVITARDGEEGLAVAQERQPDLILLDIMMPKMDGIEVCRRLKDDPSPPFMPIILVTAHSDESGQRFRRESGHPFRSKTATFSAVRFGGRDRRRWVIV